MAFWTFHISLFVNITAMVVNSYTVLYMCMEIKFVNLIGHPLKGR